MRQKLINIITVIFVIGVIATGILHYVFRIKPGLPVNQTYIEDQIVSHRQSVAEKYPDIPVKQNIPYFSSDEYFDWRIMPSYEKPEKFDVILTPRFSDPQTIEDAFPTSQSDIIQWIANQQTLISYIQIDWYIEYNQEKILVDQTNPDA